MTPEELDQIRQVVAASEARILVRQDRAPESFATDLTQVSEETRAHLQAIDRRLDRLTEQVRLLQMSVAAFNKWADNLDRDHLAHGSTQAAQQRAIDQLAAEVAEIKRRLDAR